MTSKCIGVGGGGGGGGGRVQMHSQYYLTYKYILRICIHLHLQWPRVWLSAGKYINRQTREQCICVSVCIYLPTCTCTHLHVHTVQFLM